MARLLGMDYGLQRTGLAICDPAESIVFPLAALKLADFPSRAAQLNHIAAIASSENAGGIVLGLPLYADGSENTTCKQVRNIAARLKRRLVIPVYFMPELLSTQEALEDLKLAGLKGARLKAALDQQAACRILQSFLALDKCRRMQA